MFINLFGIITKKEIGKKIVQKYYQTHVIDLEQDFCYIPMTKFFYQSVIKLKEIPKLKNSFKYLDSYLYIYLKTLSKNGAISYIEITSALYNSVESIIVWDNNKTIFGPLKSEYSSSKNQFNIFEEGISKLDIKKTDINYFKTLGLERYTKLDYNL